MIQKVYILLLFLIGFSLVSNVATACGSKAETGCCTKVNSKKTDTEACCKKDIQQSNRNNDCDGTCGNNLCRCSSFHFSIVITCFQESTVTEFNFPYKKQKLTHLESYLSSGFYSIWTPPI